MAASSDLQALQLQIRNLQQKLDWKQLKINQLEKKVRELRDGGLVADLERLERSIFRLSLQTEHMQLVIKNPRLRPRHSELPAARPCQLPSPSSSRLSALRPRHPPSVRSTPPAPSHLAPMHSALRPRPPPLPWPAWVTQKCPKGSELA